MFGKLKNKSIEVDIELPELPGVPSETQRLIRELMTVAVEQAVTQDRMRMAEGMKAIVESQLKAQRDLSRDLMILLFPEDKRNINRTWKESDKILSQLTKE